MEKHLAERSAQRGAYIWIISSAAKVTTTYCPNLYKQYPAHANNPKHLRYPLLPQTHGHQYPILTPTFFLHNFSLWSNVDTSLSRITKNRDSRGSGLVVPRRERMWGWDRAARNWASTARSIMPLLCSSSGRSGRRVFRTYCWEDKEGGEEEGSVESLLEENTAAKAERDLDSSAPVSYISWSLTSLISLTKLKPPRPIISPSTISEGGQRKKRTRR